MIISKILSKIDISNLRFRRSPEKEKEKPSLDYSGRSAHALKRVQRTGIAVQQSSAAVQPRPLGMG